MQRIMLEAGEMRCLVLPHAGGSLGGLWHQERALLRDCAASESTDPTALAGFPLVPYSNRIADARFIWAGEQIELRRNRSDEPNSLHGAGWQREWSVAELSAERAVLTLDHPGDADWPWPFTARQEIVLGGDKLTLNLSARSRAAIPVPLAIGHHPYFARENARLGLDAETVWTANAGNLPSTAARPEGPLDLSQGPPAAVLAIDNCYQQVRWPAQIGWTDWDRVLEIDAGPEMPCAVVYANAAADALCVEPVAHTSNALNLAGGHCPMPVVAPGAEHRCTMTLRLLAAGPASP